MKLRPWMKCIESKYGFIVDMERKIKAIENEHDETYDLDEEVGYALGTANMAVCALRSLTSAYDDDQGVV